MVDPETPPENYCAKRGTDDKWTHPHLDIRGFGGHEFFGFGHHGSNLKPRGKRLGWSPPRFWLGGGRNVGF